VVKGLFDEPEVRFKTKGRSRTLEREPELYISS